MEERILTIDVGTQSVRAALVTVDGAVEWIEQIHQDVDSPHPGWAQQRPASWWSMAVQGVRRALERSGTAAKAIAAVSTCGQMHGPVGIDESGAVTTEWVQLWCGKRSAPQCAAVRARCDEGRLAEISANPINPAWTGFKVMWMKDNQPEVYNASRWFLMPKDFINFRLTGVPASDPSEAAGTYLWDGRRGQYSAELADALSVDLAKFAPIRPSHEVLGKVTRQAAEQTGLVEGTAVVVGGGDFPVAMLGLGLVAGGNGADVTGSSCLFAIHSARPMVNPAIQNLRHVVDGWISFTCLDCGGMSMKWWRDVIRSARGDDASYDQLIQMAEEVEPGSEGLMFYPYILGERRYENTDAKGCFFGIGLQHKAGHFARAVMEGVAYAIAREAELFSRLGAGVDRLFCVGGGSKNALWNQIKADVLRLPLVLSDQPEAGLQGAALLGAAGVGLVDDLAGSARRRLVPKETVHPNAEVSHRYQACLEEFTRIYDHQLGFWQRTNLPPGPPPDGAQAGRQ